MPVPSSRMPTSLRKLTAAPVTTTNRQPARTPRPADISATMAAYVMAAPAATPGSDHSERFPHQSQVSNSLGPLSQGTYSNIPSQWQQLIKAELPQSTLDNSDETDFGDLGPELPSIEDLLSALKNTKGCSYTDNDGYDSAFGATDMRNSSNGLVDSVRLITGQRRGEYLNTVL